MTQDAARQLRRLLHLIPRLADGEPHSLESVAGLAGSDTTDVLRDMQSLAERYGDPGGFVPGLEIFIESTQLRMRASHFERPMGLTAPELCALNLGLAMLRGEQPPSGQAAIDRARNRLAAALTKLPANAPHDAVRSADLGAAGDSSHLATLRRGVRDRQKVRLAYRRSDAATATTRVICPYGLVASHGTWYVVAHCDDRKAIRVFRLDRVARAELLNARFDVPRSFSLDAVVRKGKVFQATEPQALRVRYSPRVARWIADREHVPVDADGSLTMEHPLADASWAVRHVLQYGPEAEVLAPASVRDAIARLLRDIVAS